MHKARAKRHVSKACNRCRLKKLKCDGNNPCGRCSRAKCSEEECVYEADGRKNRGQTHHYISYLHERNATLARALTSISKSHPELAEMCHEAVSESRVPLSLSPEPLYQDSIDSFVRDFRLVRGNEDLELSLANFKLPHTAMEDLVSMEWNLKIDEDGNTEFWGPSSNQVRNVSGEGRILLRRHKLDSDTTVEYGDNYQEGMSVLQQELARIDKTLLHRLFERYSKSLCLTIPTIQDIDLDRSDINNYPQLLGSLSKRFLLSSFFSFVWTLEKIDDRQHLFMQDAEFLAFKLLQQHTKSNDTTNLLDHLCVLRGFMLLQCTSLSLSHNSMAWSYNSIVASQLIGMGMHITTEIPLAISRDSGDTVISIKRYLEQARSKMFWSFVILDRIFTSIFGRSCAIPYKRLFTPIYEPQPCAADDDECRSEYYFSSLLKLWVLHDKFMDQIYSLHFKEQGLLHNFQLFHTALEAYRGFYNHIPPILRIGDDSSLEGVSVECLILHISLYVCLLLVLRPYLIIDELQQFVFRTSYMIAERTALLLIRINQLAISQASVTLPFYFSYFIFTVCTFYLLFLVNTNSAAAFSNNETRNLIMGRLRTLLAMMVEIGTPDVTERYILLLKERCADWHMNEDVTYTIDYYHDLSQNMNRL